MWLVHMSRTSTRRGLKNCENTSNWHSKCANDVNNTGSPVVPLVIGSLGSGIKQLTKDIKVLFKPEDVNSILSEMQKVVLWESETILRKVTSGLIQSVCVIDLGKVLNGMSVKRGKGIGQFCSY